jgi:hypothetical protein
MNRITALETDSISGQNKPFAVKTDVDGFEFCEGIESRLRELAALSSTLIESDTESMSADDHAAGMGSCRQHCRPKLDAVARSPGNAISGQR